MAGPRSLLAIVAVGIACAVAPGAEPETPKPSRWLVEISAVGEVGPYLDATVANERFSHRFFFPRSVDCGEVLRSGEEVQYRTIGPFGRLGNEAGSRCDPVGVGSLKEWRDAMPRRRSRFRTPREQAAFETIHQGDDLLLLRGRFPLTLEIRWPEPMDSVAVTPNGPECRELLDRETTTMEFHHQGPNVFLLETDRGYCPIIGLVLPLAVE
jgi:hypothetical protein